MQENYLKKKAQLACSRCCPSPERSRRSVLWVRESSRSTWVKIYPPLSLRFLDVDFHFLAKERHRENDIYNAWTSQVSWHMCPVLRNCTGPHSMIFHNCIYKRCNVGPRKGSIDTGYHHASWVLEIFAAGGVEVAVSTNELHFIELCS